MQIDLNRITDQALEITDTFPADHLPLLTAWSKSGEGRFIKPVTVRLQIRRTGKLIEVAGRVRTAVELVCVRCLEAFEEPLEQTLRVHFSPAPAALPEQTPTKEIQLDGDDIGHYQYEGERLDLSQALAEEALAGLPLQPLCREECRGLCPGCGASLNRTDCDCAQEAVDPRWAALAKFKA